MISISIAKKLTATFFAFYNMLNTVGIPGILQYLMKIACLRYKYENPLMNVQLHISQYGQVFLRAAYYVIIH